jgi:hypothetical protein
LASSLALSPLLEYLHLLLSALGPAELLSELSASYPTPKGRPAHLKHTSKPSREAFRELLNRLQTPKDLLTTSSTLPNFSGSPSSNSQPDLGPRRNHHQASRTRSNFRRTRPRRSTVTHWNSKEPRNAPSLRFRALAEPINRHQRRLKIPKNLSTTHQPSGNRGTFQRTSHSPPDSEEPFSELSARIQAP